MPLDWELLGILQEPIIIWRKWHSTYIKLKCQNIYTRRNISLRKILLQAGLWSLLQHRSLPIRSFPTITFATPLSRGRTSFGVLSIRGVIWRLNPFFHASNASRVLTVFCAIRIFKWFNFPNKFPCVSIFSKESLQWKPWDWWKGIFQLLSETESIHLLH
jgi:hypothetical protein